MAFSEEFLNELRLRNPVEIVIGDYVNLKRAGRNLKGLCPFHAEKTPSFVIYPDTSSFFCFGCGAGGDVITFIKRIENLDYVEAVRLLASRAGMNMPEDEQDKGLSLAKNKIREINREAARFFYKMLISADGKSALEYLYNRGMKPETVKKFGVGFAPDSWDMLSKHLISMGFYPDDIIAADLGFKNKFGGVNDRFRNRVMFPIIDLHGNVVGFGGRDLTGKSNAKYINTSDTLVYKKTKNLFALNLAKGSSGDELILCEGYMDCAALHQAGFSNAIATCGTALTDEQTGLLARYTKSVILSYDADEAGQKAAKRAIPMLRKVGLSIKVLVVKGAKDPDEYIKKNGGESFKQLIDSSPTDIEYLIDCERQKINMSSPDGRFQFLNKAAEIISMIDNKIEQDVYIGNLSLETGVDKQSISDQLKSNYLREKRIDEKKLFTKMTKEISGREDKVNKERSSNLRATVAEDNVISYLYHNPDKFREISSQLPPEKMVTSFNRRVYEHLLKLCESSSNVNLSGFSADFSDEEMGAITRLFLNDQPVRISEEDAKNCIKTILGESEALSQEDVSKSDPQLIKDYLAKLAKNKG